MGREKGTKGKVKKGELKKTLDILKRALEVEYRFIFHYPSLARRMPNEDLASKIEVLGRDSIRHADIISKTVSRLEGGDITPIPTIEELPKPLDLRDLMGKQLELERLALWLHTQAAERVGKELEPALRQIAQQERWHISLTKEIISGLGELRYFPPGSSVNSSV